MATADQSSVEPSVIARTDRWLAVSKPSGWLTIPGRGSADVPVLVDWARKAHGSVWTVHRIDRETSGVVLLALTAEAHREASLWFQEHRVKKSYDLLALGSLRIPFLRISTPVHELPCVTQVEVRERYSGSFLGRATPLSGRRHQIRIHLSGEGHALLGDSQYGGPREFRGLQIGRVALHASRLELPDGNVFEAPWPEDFSGWVKYFKGEA